MKAALGLASLAALAAAASAAVRPAPTAHEIARKTQDRYTGDDVSTALEMRLVDPKGRVRRREFLMYQKTIKGLKVTLYKFLLPGDIKDTGTLNQEIRDAEDIQHIYLPAARKLRRISAKNQAWMGSDIMYEDLEQIDVDRYKHELLGTPVVDGQKCYRYSMVPRAPGESIYSKQIWTVRVKDFVPLRREFYDKEGRLLKKTRLSDWRDAGGAHYAWHAAIENVQEGHRTELIRRWIFLNTGIPGRLLSTRHLEKPLETYDHPRGMMALWRKALPRD